MCFGGGGSPPPQITNVIQAPPTPDSSNPLDAQRLALERFRASLRQGYSPFFSAGPRGTGPVSSGVQPAKPPAGYMGGGGGSTGGHTTQPAPPPTPRTQPAPPPTPRTQPAPVPGGRTIPAPPPTTVVGGIGTVAAGVRTATAPPPTTTPPTALTQAPTTGGTRTMAAPAPISTSPITDAIQVALGTRQTSPASALPPPPPPPTLSTTLSAPVRSTILRRLTAPGSMRGAMAGIVPFA